MANERWDSPFPHTIPFLLFKKHFTELNNVYWAHVPAANTIEKKALDELEDEKADPKQYFLIHDEDDRRIASTYNEWKKWYREFSNYTRLNMIMLLSSCFETYLRTIVSLSLESKPGIIIKAPDAVDGWFLYRKDRGYGEYGSKEYQFLDEIDSICKGDWQNRASAYKKLFGKMPLSEDDISKLNQLRQKRNLVGHFFGREKQKYEVPLLLIPESAQRISHDSLIGYFALINNVVTKIDGHLHKDYIGSYDVIKYYYMDADSLGIVNATAGERAKNMQKFLGRLGLPPAGTEYYSNIIAYTLVENENDSCRYKTKVSITEVNRRLAEQAVSLQIDGRPVRFSMVHFRLFANVYAFRDNPDLCKKYECNGKVEYFYSSRAIDLIVEKIRENPTDIIRELKSQKRMK